MNQPPTGGLIILMQSGPRFRERLIRGQNTKSDDFVTLLSAFVLDKDKLKKPGHESFDSHPGFLVP